MAKITRTGTGAGAKHTGVYAALRDAEEQRHARTGHRKLIVDGMVVTDQPSPLLAGLRAGKLGHRQLFQDSEALPTGRRQSVHAGHRLPRWTGGDVSRAALAHLEYRASRETGLWIA